MVYYNESEMIAYLPEDRGGISLQKLDIACQFIEAIQVAIHDRPCEVIKIGYSNGGFRARYKIDKGKFDKRAKRFKNHMQGCNLAVTGRSALGSSVGFLVVKRIAKAVLIENMVSQYVIMKIEQNKKKLENERKKKLLNAQTEEDETMMT